MFPSPAVGTFTRLSLLRKLLLSVCMGMLLFSATLEASHSCGELVLHSWQHGSGSAERAYGDGGICLTCITLQAAAQAVCYSAWSPIFVTAEAVDSDELPAPSIEQQLALYSRPPPVRS